MTKIYEKLIQVQTKLKVPKSQFNAFGKYSYRNCEDICEALKPLLREVGATLTLTDEVILIGDRYYVQATACFTDIEDGEIIYTKGLAREEDSKKGMDLSQVSGSTSSYARKYALNGLFAIDDTKDADFTNKHGKEDAPDKTENKQPPKQPPKQEPKQEFAPKQETPSDKVTIEQIQRMFSIAGKGNEPKVRDIMFRHGYASSKEIKKKDYEKIINEIMDETEEK